MAKKRKTAKSQSQPSSSGEINREYGEDDSSTAGLLDDTLLQVFTRIPTRFLLSSAALVCRRWRRLSQSDLVELVPPIVPTLKCKPWGSMTYKRLWELAEKNASSLEKVVFRGFITENLTTLISLLHRLTDLSIEYCEGADDANEIVSSLPIHLRKLHLKQSHKEVQLPQDNQILTDLHAKTPSLESLHLNYNLFLNPETIHTAFLPFRCLTSLHLVCHGINWCHIKNILRSCRQLSHFSVVSQLLDHEAFNTSRRRFKLKSSSDSDSDTFDCPPSLSSIRIHSSPANSVDLSSPTPLFILRQVGHQISHIYAQGSFNSSWSSISVWCLNLKLLDLSHVNCYALTEVEEVILSQIPRLLKKLERVALPNATDRILTAFGRFCPQLQELRFQSGIKIPVTDRGVIALTEGCSELEVLSLEGCENLTISSIRSLTFHCHKLKALHLPNYKTIDDAAVTALLPSLVRSIRFLDLVNCRELTFLSLSHMLKYFQTNGNCSLKILAIRKSMGQLCSYYTKEMEKLCPNLSIRRGHSGYEFKGFYEYESLLDL